MQIKENIRATGLCAGNSPGTGEFPAQMASNAGNVSIWWRRHGDKNTCTLVSAIYATAPFIALFLEELIRKWIFM